ncbi:MAG: DUF4097 family beta strand repeat-containing protein [Candidatus Acidiferrales bacterium]
MSANPATPPTNLSSPRRQRRSIFGGLLLISIGILFLLHEHLPELGIWHLFSRYWPLLLILWGLAKLFDSLAADRAGESKPPLVTGGEMALVVALLLIVGGMISVDWIHRKNPDFSWGEGWFSQKYSTTEELPVQPVKPGSEIHVSTDRGNITVYADESNDLRIIAYKTATASSQYQAQKRAEQASVSIQSVAGGYEIQPIKTEQGNGAVKVDLEVHIPKQASVTAKSDRGDINISDVSGGLNISTESGDIEIHGAGGDVTAELHRGDARVSEVKGNVRVSGRGNVIELEDIGGDAAIDGEFYGPIRVNNVKNTTTYNSARTQLTLLHLSGRFEMDSGGLQISDVAGNAILSTHNRDVEVENVAGRLQIASTHGDVQVRYAQPPKEEVTITNDSGGVDLTLPAKASFEISAVSRSGDVQSDFEDSGLQLVNDNDTHKLSGKFGSRGPRIQIATTYGTISLRKGE